MTDIVERLRAIDHMSVEDCFLQSPLFLRAAEEIEHLRLSLSEARATGRREGLSEAAGILLAKAAGLRANENPTSTAMAMIFEEQSAAIRAAMEK